MSQVEHIEFYYPKTVKGDDLCVLRERIKNFHFYQCSSPEEFDIANKPQMIKLDNNIYYKKFNLIAN